jgi:hypothetical protein
VRSVAAARAAAINEPPLLGKLASTLLGRPVTARYAAQRAPARERPAGVLRLSMAVCEVLVGYAVAEPWAPRAGTAAGLEVAEKTLGSCTGSAAPGGRRRSTGGRLLLPDDARAGRDSGTGARAAEHAAARAVEPDAAALAPARLPDSLEARREIGRSLTSSVTGGAPSPPLQHLPLLIAEYDRDARARHPASNPR